MEEKRKKPDIDLDKIKSDLVSSKSNQQLAISRIRDWRDAIEAEGKYKFNGGDDRSSYSPKVVRSSMEWRYTSLEEPFLSSVDLFEMKPLTYADKGSVDQHKLLLNHQFRTQINKTKLINDYIRCAASDGTVILRVGWETKTKKIKEEAPTIIIGDDGNEQVVVEQIEKEVIIKDSPTINVCKIEDVFIDPTCEGDTDKAAYFIYRYNTTITALKDAGHYKNLDDIKLDIDPEKQNSDHEEYSDNNSISEDKAKKVTVYEYWGLQEVDESGKAEAIVCEFVDDVKIREDFNPFPDSKPPFVLVQYLPQPFQLYGESDAELIKDNQLLIGAMSRGIIDLFGRSANAQQGIRKDLLDNVNRKRFLAGEDYEFNPVANPRDAFFTNTFPEIPQSAFIMIQSLQQEIEALTGVKSYQASGLNGDALGQTARGVSATQSAQAKRELSILKRLSDGLVQCAKKIVLMNEMYLTDEQIVSVIDEEPIRIDPAHLQLSGDVIITINTSENDAARAEELSFMLQTMGNTADPELTKMILVEIAGLRKMPDLAKRIEQFQPQPDPVQQKLQELEIAKIDAEIRRINAQAEKAQAEADKIDLEYVEQETGTKHERDVDRIRSQAESNLATSLVQNELGKNAA